MSRIEVGRELKVVASDDVVRVVGDLDRSTASTLRAALDHVVDATSGEVRIDVTAVAFVDPAGLEVLVEPVRRGHPVVLIGPSHQLQALLQLEGRRDRVRVEP